MILSGVYKTFMDRWNQFQTAWIISDLHFNEDDLKRAFPNRPSDDELVRRINAKCGRKDILFVLGDCGDLEYVKKLRGYKVLIAGNHDTGITKYEEVFDEVYEGVLIIGEKLILSHEPVNIPWLFDFHGHNHFGKAHPDKMHMNVCADVLGYVPAHLNSLLNGGIASKVYTIHRSTIDFATKKKLKRGGKKIGEK
jgi:calcineurin-like phosphoesterase family protein